MAKILTYETALVAILKRNELARDSDAILYGALCVELVGRNAFNAMSARDLLMAVHEKRLPSLWTIDRARRKIQEMYPETRGKEYGRRQAEEINVLAELSYTPKSSAANQQEMFKQEEPKREPN